MKVLVISSHSIPRIGAVATCPMTHSDPFEGLRVLQICSALISGGVAAAGVDQAAAGKVQLLLSEPDPVVSRAGLGVNKGIDVDAGKIPLQEGDAFQIVERWRPETQEAIVARVKPDLLVYTSSWSHLSLRNKPDVPLVVDLHLPRLAGDSSTSSPDRPDQKLRVLAMADLLLCATRAQQLYFSGWMMQAGRVAQLGVDLILVPDAFSNLLFSRIAGGEACGLPDSRSRSDTTASTSTFVAEGCWSVDSDLSEGVTELSLLLNNFNLGSAGTKNPLPAVSSSQLGAKLVVLGSPEGLGRPRCPSEALIAERFALLKASSSHATERLQVIESFGLRELAQLQGLRAVGFVAASSKIRAELMPQQPAVFFLWCGYPIICSSFSDISEKVWEYEAGWIVDSPAGRELEMVVDEIKSNPEVVAIRGANALRLAENYFNIEAGAISGSAVGVAPLLVKLMSSLAVVGQGRLAGYGGGGRAAPVLGQISSRPPLFEMRGESADIVLTGAATTFEQRFVSPVEALVGVAVDYGFYPGVSRRELSVLLQLMQEDGSLIVERRIDATDLDPSGSLSIILPPQRTLVGGSPLKFRFQLSPTAPDRSWDPEVPLMVVRGVVDCAYPVVGDVVLGVVREGRFEKVGSTNSGAAVAFNFLPSEFSARYVLRSQMQRAVSLVRRGEWRRVGQAVSRRVTVISDVIRERFVQRTLLLLLITALSACILPPDKITPETVAPGELEFVSMLQRGIDLARSSRPDLAEVEFRKVLLKDPSHANAYINLGVILQTQGRLEEAVESFRTAIECEPHSFTAHDGLARALFRKGDLTEAVKEFELLLSLYYGARGGDQREAGTAAKIKQGQPRYGNSSKMPAFDNQRAAELYRSLSGVYYFLGDLDKAYCFSQIAAELDQSDLQVGEHVRLLLAIERSPMVAEYLGPIVAARNNQLPTKLTLDHGMALYSLGKYQESSEAFTTVLSSQGAAPIDRANAALLALVTFERLEKDWEKKLLSQTLLEDYPDLCDPKFLSRQEYWPLAVRTDVAPVLEKLCVVDENQSFFGSGGRLGF